jgi:hypothetical protein
MNRNIEDLAGPGTGESFWLSGRTRAFSLRVSGLRDSEQGTVGALAFENKYARY